MNEKEKTTIDTCAYVIADVEEERLGPTEASEAVNRLYRGQRVQVFEEKDGWCRVSRYCHHFFDERQFARWLRMSSLSPDKPAPPKHELPDTTLGTTLVTSDDVGKYWKRFLQGAKRAMKKGLTLEEDIVESGGWVRTTRKGYENTILSTRVFMSADGYTYSAYREDEPVEALAG